MGTHGKKLTNELIGSVTAEVMESCLSPVFAVPMKTSLQSPDDIQRVAFLTNFDQKDLIAIDRAISLFASDNVEMYFIHASDKKEAWSEVMLAGIKAYFSTHYPQLGTNYELLNATDSPEILNNYMISKKK